MRTPLDVTYLAYTDDLYMELILYLSCPTCGHPMVEDPVPGGVMFRCWKPGQQGEQPPADAPADPTHFFFAFEPS